MSIAVQHDASPDYWMCYLAASIGHFLNGNATDRDLLEDYRAFLNTDERVLLPEGRACLPLPPKKKVAR